MKHIRYIVSVVTCFALCGPLLGKTKFVIVTAAYNNKEWCEATLASILCQDYPEGDFRAIYIDDNSCDHSLEKAKQCIQNLQKEHLITVIQNDSRKGALCNIYHAVHTCDPHEVVVIVDGDDRLVHLNVLSFLDEIYTHHDVWLTYGQYIEYPSCTVGFCAPLAPDIITYHMFRRDGFIPSHLRTFYAGLFHKIKKEDLLDKAGNFLMMAGDSAAMLPMIEMAADHFYSVSQVLYVYNRANPLNDDKISRWLQLHLDSYVRAKPPYEKLSHLFD